MFLLSLVSGLAIVVYGLGLAWIEEPIIYDNLDGYAQLASELKTPLQMGENFYGPRELHKALQKKACDLVMPDFMRIGVLLAKKGYDEGGCPIGGVIMILYARTADSAK